MVGLEKIKDKKHRQCFIQPAHMYSSSGDGNCSAQTVTVPSYHYRHGGAVSEEGLLPCEVGPDAIVPVSSSGGKMSGKGKGPLDPAFAAGFNAMFLVICLKCLEVRTQHLLPTTSYPIKGQ